jgi:hypothetical protein
LEAAAVGLGVDIDGFKQVHTFSPHFITTIVLDIDMFSPSHYWRLLEALVVFVISGS